MRPEAVASWRWRLLKDRAVIDAGLFEADGDAPSAAVASAMADVAASYHMTCPGPSAVCRCKGPRGAACPGPLLRPLRPVDATCAVPT